ncbi:olfactory receptor 2K2-like [Lissotriton helveticus]
MSEGREKEMWNTCAASAWNSETARLFMGTMTGILNQTLEAEFELLGFSYQLERIFLVIYMVTLTANSLIIVAIQAGSRLRTPMYFFLSNLSFIDICYTSSTVPKVLEGLISKRSVITFAGCAAQMYGALSLGVTQCILLAVMAWDRYVAICNPLNYVMVMNRSFCITLAVVTWCSGFLLSVVHVSVTLTVPFCGHRKIDFSSCEVTALLRLACTDIRLQEGVIFMMSVVILLVPFSIILFTYSYIISTILRMMTAAGRQKAFSTCGSHMLVVTLFFGTAMAMYLRPRSKISPEKDKVLTLTYGAVTPMLNPLLYSLHNQEVKLSLQKLIYKKRIPREQEHNT